MRVRFCCAPWLWACVVLTVLGAVDGFSISRGFETQPYDSTRRPIEDPICYQTFMEQVRYGEYIVFPRYPQPHNKIRDEEKLAYLAQAHECCPFRAEPLLKMAKIYQSKSDYKQAFYYLTLAFRNGYAGDLYCEQGNAQTQRLQQHSRRHSLSLDASVLYGNKRMKHLEEVGKELVLVAWQAANRCGVVERTRAIVVGFAASISMLLSTPQQHTRIREFDYYRSRMLLLFTNALVDSDLDAWIQYHPEAAEIEDLRSRCEAVAAHIPLSVAVEQLMNAVGDEFHLADFLNPSATLQQYDAVRDALSEKNVSAAVADRDQWQRLDIDLHLPAASPLHSEFPAQMQYTFGSAIQNRSLHAALPEAALRAAGDMGMQGCARACFERMGGRRGRPLAAEVDWSSGTAALQPYQRVDASECACGDVQVSAQGVPVYPINADIPVWDPSLDVPSQDRAANGPSRRISLVLPLVYKDWDRFLVLLKSVRRYMAPTDALDAFFVVTPDSMFDKVRDGLQEQHGSVYTPSWARRWNIPGSTAAWQEEDAPTPAGDPWWSSVWEAVRAGESSYAIRSAETAAMARVAASDFVDSAIPVVLLRDSQVVPEFARNSSFRGLHGWWKQQVIKLEVTGRWARTAFTITLDADCLLARPLGYRDVVRANPADGKERCITNIDNHNNWEEWWTGSEHLLGLRRPYRGTQADDSTEIGVTPACLSGEITRQMLQFLEHSRAHWLEDYIPANSALKFSDAWRNFKKAAGTSRTHAALRHEAEQPSVAWLDEGVRPVQPGKVPDRMVLWRELDGDLLGFSRPDSRGLRGPSYRGLLAEVYAKYYWTEYSLYYIYARNTGLFFDYHTHEEQVYKENSCWHSHWFENFEMRYGDYSLVPSAQSRGYFVVVQSIIGASTNALHEKVSPLGLTTSIEAESESTKDAASTEPVDATQAQMEKSEETTQPEQSEGLPQKSEL